MDSREETRKDYKNVEYCLELNGIGSCGEP